MARFSWLKGFLRHFLATLVVFSIFVWSALYLSAGPGPDPSTIAMLAVVISAISVVIAAVGTLSGVLLGWRSDRRQAREHGLKMEQLKTDLERTRTTADKSKGNDTPTSN